MVQLSALQSCLDAVCLAPVQSPLDAVCLAVVHLAVLQLHFDLRRFTVLQSGLDLVHRSAPQRSVFRGMAIGGASTLFRSPP